MSWQIQNLAELEERPATKPTLGQVGLVYPGKRHVFSGPQESAKTLAAYLVALSVIRGNGTAVVIDFEMGPWDARDRLRDLGASDDELARLLYVEPDAPAVDPIANADAIGDLVELAPDLVVLDAAAGAYGLERLDDNKRADAERFAAIYVGRFWRAGIATIVIDHVGKNADQRGKYAIGSERKIGGADVHLGFEPITELTRGGRGLYRITTHKDRLGHLPRPRAAELELHSDPTTHAIAALFRPADAEDEAAPFRPTALMERVSRHLELQAGPFSRNAIEEAVRGKRAYVRLAVDCLVREGYATEAEGERSARLVASLTPFREDDLAPTSPRENGRDLAPTSPRNERHGQAELATSPDLAPTSPRSSHATSPHLALSLQGERGGRGEVVDDIDQEEIERLAKLGEDLAR